MLRVPSFTKYIHTQFNALKPYTFALRSIPYRTSQSHIQSHKYHHKHPTTTPRSTMADDSSYSTFLSKANEDPKSGSRADQHTASTSQARSKYDPTTPSDALPAALRSLPDTPYVSDTDSDWEAVFFNYADNSVPSLDQFKDVLKASKGDGDWDVSELSVKEFDPRGQYAEVVDRVRKAGEEVGGGTRGKVEGEGVKVYRVEVGKTRVEYYVLTVGERKLMGVVAKAVES